MFPFNARNRSPGIGSGPGKVAAPVFSPVAGGYGPTQNVTMTTSTVGATIYYTTDGSEPDSGSTEYTGPVEVSVTTTLKAIAIDGVLTDSNVTTGVYTINGQVATPVISPAADTYDNDQSITITCATASVAIYYTTDGSTPDNTKTLYTGAFTLGASATVKAIALRAGFTDSAVASNAYVLEVATPTFSPPADTYPSAEDVTISSDTTGATIYYTTDGSDPTTSSTLYTGPVNVASSLTLKALGVKAGYTDSAIGSAAYVISAGPPMTDMVAWYRKGVGQTDAGGGACSEWADQSGLGNDIVQATGSAQPAIQGDGTLLFDGTADNLSAAFTNGLPQTVYIRFKAITWTFFDRIWDGRTLGRCYLGQHTSTPTLKVNDSLSMSPNLALNTYGSVAVQYETTGALVQLDGNSPVTSATATAASTGITLGASGSGGANFANCQIAEFIVYNAVHDQTTRDAIIAYLDTVI